MKAHQIANTWKECSNIIDAINNNCMVDNEKPIPMKFYMNSLNFWCIECLNEADNARLEKHLEYILNN